MEKPEHSTNKSEYYEDTKLDAPEKYAPSTVEHSLESYLELYAELRETQRALSQDFKSIYANDRTALERLASPHVDRINASRQQAGAEPIPIDQMSDRFLLGLAEPSWKTLMPKDPDDTEAAQVWEEFKASLDDDLVETLEDLYELHAKIDSLQSDEKLMGEVDAQRLERIKVVTAATKYLKKQQRIEDLSEKIAGIRIRAARSSRPLTRRERERIEILEQKINHEKTEEIVDPTVPMEDFYNEIDRLDRRKDKKDLESGLLMTDQMEELIAEVLPALSRGEPSLLVGETGGAKTALAEFISEHYFGVTPEIVSGYGDVNSYQLMGKQELREENGATVSEFVPGPIVRAMEDGRPLILDEINAMPPELLKRLNKIMQLRPGDKFSIQEDSGRVVEVKPGFCIIATANEKSKRYKAVDDLSVEFQNRFGANIYRVRYPDVDISYDELPIENERLAFAAVASRRGEFPDDIDPVDFDNFVRACFVSQQVFTGNHGTGFSDFVTHDRQADNKPGLEETVLAPRTMVDILRKVVGSHGEISIKMACLRFLDGIKNTEDRKVMALILEGHNLLERTE